jgi:hypothetical protein
MAEHKYLSNFDFFFCGLMPFLACCIVTAPFCFGNMACCANGIMPNFKHSKPFLFGVWFINLGINIIQCEVDALGRISFVLV